MTDTSITIASSARIATVARAGVAANYHAARTAASDYRTRKSDNTLAAHDTDLTTFGEYLAHVGVNAAGPVLSTNPASWQGMTWGLVKGFVAWMLGEGYAIGSINRKLSTVKVYAKLASQAGAINTEDLALIRSVTGYGRKEGKRIDERRLDTRMGSKKSAHVALTSGQAAQLKTQPATAQGRRDALLMALLLDLGLRVGEVTLLEVADFDLQENLVRFYRPKVDVEQTHRMTADLRKTVTAWLDSGDCPASGPILRSSRKGGALTAAGMSDRAITERVKVLGENIGIVGLSAHDCRHYWASRAASQGTDAFALRDAGGWNSLAMPSRYVEAATIANERVRL